MSLEYDFKCLFRKLIIQTFYINKVPHLEEPTSSLAGSLFMHALLLAIALFLQYVSCIIDDDSGNKIIETPTLK